MLYSVTTQQTLKFMLNCLGRNFSEDPILALLARLFSSLKLCIANNTYCVDNVSYKKSLKFDTQFLG